MLKVHIPIEKLYSEPFTDYRDIGLLDILEKESFGDPLILKGPKGTGKTMGVQQHCAIKSYPYLRFDCSEWTALRDLQGSMTQTEDKHYAFALGCLTTSLELANKVGEFVCILEEINALTPNAQKLLNGMGDFRQSIQIPKIGEVFQLEKPVYAEIAGKILSIDQIDEGINTIVFDNEHMQDITDKIGLAVSVGDCVKAGDPLTVIPQLWLIGTMNPSSYGGTYLINEDMLSRFDFINVPYMTQSNERDLLKEMFGPSMTDDQHQFCRHLVVLATNTRASTVQVKNKTVEFGYALSTRDLVKVIRRYRRTDDGAYALKVLSNKYDGETRKDFECLVERVFKKIKIADMELIHGARETNGVTV